MFNLLNYTSESSVVIAFSVDIISTTRYSLILHQIQIRVLKRHQNLPFHTTSFLLPSVQK